MAIAAADKVVHGNDLTYITQQYKNYFQAKESGKGLSTNDYTTTEKNKLAGIDASADVNVIETVKLNGTALTPDANKAVNVEALPISGGTATGPITVAEVSGNTVSSDQTVVYHDRVVVANGLIGSATRTIGVYADKIDATVAIPNTANTGTYSFTFPAASGVLALRSQIPAALSELSDDVGYLTSSDLSDYVPLAGGTMDTGASLTFVDGTNSEDITEIESGKIAVKRLNLPSTDPDEAFAITLDSTTPEVIVNAPDFGMSAKYRFSEIVHRKNNTNYTLSFPTESGTLAVTTDIPPVSYILNNSNLTGTPTAPTASAGTNTTQVATTAFVTTAVNNAIGSVVGLSFNTDYSTYAALAETTGTGGVIYLIPNSGTSPNSYDEYFWNGSGYEKFGTTDVDLSGYVQTSALETLTTSEITTLLNL